ncbi:MAG TPA: hypothetical protein VL688_02405 [Verrucomicrobiae bacterium]|jgi:hypothetical protein|nr:hypothetical protein [Verrucomicrobiae bacterium]
MANDVEAQKQFEAELQRLTQAQQEEMKKKCNPLFAKMHGMSDEEMADLKNELQKVHDMQKQELARKFGVSLP